MQTHNEIILEIVGADMTVEERIPVLCEIVRKTEHLQVRAVALLWADEAWKPHGSWTAFCRSEFGWDDSYASRIKKAAEMILDGTTITNEAQARALSTVPKEKRNDIMKAARDALGCEPSASQITRLADAEEDKAPKVCHLKDDQEDIDEIIKDLNDIMKRVKLLPVNAAGKWINLPHITSDIKNAVDALKHSRPHGACDEGPVHDEHCICGGTGWLPKSVLARAKDFARL